MSDEHLKSVDPPAATDRLGAVRPAGPPRPGAPLFDGPTSDGLLPRLTSRQLFGMHNELQIEHAGFTYRLRITQANKLILTK